MAERGALECRKVVVQPYGRRHGKDRSRQGPAHAPEVAAIVFEPDWDGPDLDGIIA